MSLSTAFNIAQSALLNTGRQTSVVSRNISDAHDPNYSRRSALISSLAPGARVVEIRRATNELLFRQNLSALSSWSGQSAVTAGVDRLGLAVNGVDNAQSPATAIGALQQALQLYSASPSNRNLAYNAIEAARQVTRTLNEGTAAIQSFRAETDGEIATAVGDLNDLLNSFHETNKAILLNSRSGRDISDLYDQREGLLKKISEFVPISTFTRPDNDMVITTADGVTLYETVPRAVTFESTTTFVAGVEGNAIYIDGIPVLAGAGGNTDAAGKLAGLLQLRDGVATTMQSQLDEIARGLITAFAEKDPGVPATLPDAPGLFTWPGAPGMPAAGTLTTGLAGTIKLNPAMDATVGGSSFLLRDGGANGAGYITNTTGSASYSELLIAYGDRLDQPMTFDGAAGLGAQSSLSGYSVEAIGWFEGLRQNAARAAEAKEALSLRSAEALSNDVGVNVDTEMSLLLDLEHSYEASARLLKAVDDMLATLFDAVR